MRRQPPTDNNPANPLFKVAALGIDKEYIGKSSSRKAKIKVTLSFKQSNDLRGRAVSADGRQINVVFGLSIRRATLELTCTDDKGKSPEGLAKIEDVAYVSPFAMSESVKDSVSKDETIKKTLSGSLGTAIKSGLDALSPSASASGSASGEAASTRASKREVTRSFANLNVAATYGGNVIHWEMGPTRSLMHAAKDYLDGGLFISNDGIERLDACVITREDGGPIASLTITASLSTSTKDMLLGEIDFMDDDGCRVEWCDVRPAKNSNTLKDAFFQKDAKDRLIKQIIRKHLVDQGMQTHGDLVEICRAST